MFEKIQTFERLYFDIIKKLQEVPEVSDLITPMPIEYYMSNLVQEVKKLEESYVEGFIEGILYHANRALALILQILDRVSNIVEIYGKIKKNRERVHVGILT